MLRWESAAGDVIEGGDHIKVRTDQADEWSALIKVPPDAMLRTSFVVADEDE